MEWEEWGNPVESAEVYDYMKSYAPYENVEAKALPADARHRRPQRPPGVATGSRPSGWPSCGPPRPTTTALLLKTEMGAGHMGPSRPLRRLAGRGLRAAPSCSTRSASPTSGPDARRRAEPRDWSDGFRDRRARRRRAPLLPPAAVRPGHRPRRPGRPPDGQLRVPHRRPPDRRGGGGRPRLRRRRHLRPRRGRRHAPGRRAGHPLPPGPRRRARSWVTPSPAWPTCRPAARCRSTCSGRRRPASPR